MDANCQLAPQPYSTHAAVADTVDTRYAEVLSSNHCIKTFWVSTSLRLVKEMENDDDRDQLVWYPGPSHSIVSSESWIQYQAP